MQQVIQSPLPPLIHDNGTGGPIPFWHAIGVAAQLMLEHTDYQDLTVALVFNRVNHQLSRGQGQIFLDDDHRPIGYASWLIVDQRLHDRLISSESVDNETLLGQVAETQDTYLWFMDLISPFGTSLPVLRQLREQMNQFQQAWLVSKSPVITGSGYTNGQVAMQLPRRLW